MTRPYHVIGLVLLCLFTFSQTIHSQSTETLTFWHSWQYDPEAAAINQLIADFNASQSEITMVGVPFENYEDLRQELSQSSERPDISLSTYLDVQGYTQNGFILPLELGESKDLNPKLLALFQDSGQQWGIPFGVSAQVLAVNMTLLDRLGYYSSPQTFEDFQEIACTAARTDGLKGYPLKAGASDFESFLIGQGGRVFENGHYSFDSPEVIGVLQFYQALYDENCAYLPEMGFGGMADFAAGIIPMTQTTTRSLSFITEDMRGNPSEWMVTTTPSIQGQRSLQIYSTALVISKPNAQAFIDFLMEAEPQSFWSQQTAYLPINIAAEVGDSPQLAQAFALLNDPTIRLYQSPSEPSYHLSRELISEAVIDVTVNGRDVQETAETLQEKADILQTSPLGE
jgi:ABC-type glycerol-3-phosphate transport system substrate-binding protein